MEEAATTTPISPEDLPSTGAGSERTLGIILVIVAVLALLVGYERWDKRTRLG